MRKKEKKKFNTCATDADSHCVNVVQNAHYPTETVKGATIQNAMYVRREC